MCCKSIEGSQEHSCSSPKLGFCQSELVGVPAPQLVFLFEHMLEQSTMGEAFFSGHGEVLVYSRVAGYGRKRVANPRQREKQEQLAGKIDTLTEQLKDAIETRSVHEQAIARLIPKERWLRQKTKLVSGKRIASRSVLAEFENCGKEIRRHERAITTIEQSHKKEFKQLSKSQREWLRLQGKEAPKTEPDTLSTYFCGHSVPPLDLSAHT
jgi:hypothetical protein